MHVSRWGNSLAVRLPTALVNQLGLKEGDDVEMALAGSRAFTVERKMTRDEASEALKTLRQSLPPLSADFKFDREEANQREWVERLDPEGERRD